MNQYTAKESVVAFIDILGASAKIQKNSAETLNIVHNAYDDALSAFSRVCRNVKNPPAIKIFSDNIVISCPCTAKEAHGTARKIIVLSAMLQEKLLTHNILVRGGIAKGDFFSDDVMLWGRALVDAYGLENSVAIFPRIVIHPNLVRDLGLRTQKEKASAMGFNVWLAEDHDGLFYVDYFHDFSCIKEPLIRILHHIDTTFERIAENHDNIKVCQKLIWQGNYLKRKLSELPAEASDELLASTGDPVGSEENQADMPDKK
ncbi:MAG: hypothetical protein E7643_06930 [Ruminococcaceae bacterium]|nr:hypothetical protein [Oscillospiraceae bacterium]